MSHSSTVSASFSVSSIDQAPGIRHSSAGHLHHMQKNFALAALIPAINARNFQSAARKTQQQM